jgi:hypothetical protein
MMDFKLKALFTLTEPTLDKLANIKQRIIGVLQEEDAIGVSLDIDFGVTEFFRSRGEGAG